MKNNNLKFIDLFSGAGGLSCGLELAGHTCLLGVDFDKHAIETFKANHKEAESFCGDLRKLTTPKLKSLLKGQEVDLVVGGPPCQGFSTVGKGNPKDERNHLFLEFVRIVKVTRPSFVVVENVTGLLAKKNEATLKAILCEFTRLGYNLGIRVLSAQEYGVPEHRRRTIIIGSRINSNVLFPTPTHLNDFITVGDVIYDLKDRTGEVHNHTPALSKLKSKIDEDRLKKIPDGRGIRYQEDERKYLPKSLHLGVNWEKLPEKRFRQTRYQRLDSKRVSPTIMTHRHGYFHPKENRYLTPREAAKIQSFPNNFVFKGPLSAQWRQIGNAVPPLLAKAIGEALLKMKKSSLVRLKVKKYDVPLSEIAKIRERAFVYEAPKA